MEIETYWFQALIINLIGDLYWYSCGALENVRTERSIWEIKYNYKRFDNYTLHVVIMQSLVHKAYAKVLFRHELDQMKNAITD